MVRNCKGNDFIRENVFTVTVRKLIYTVLNFAVDNIEHVVLRLSARGVRFEAVEGTNEQGIAEMDAVKAAWFKDPAGKWIGLFQGIKDQV